MRYIKLTIKINSTDKPPYFIGSQLRGAFGYALKNIANIDNDNIYSKFFEEKDVTHQYRFDIRLGVQAYNFSFYLFEESCDEIFTIICAFHEMLTKIGLGKVNKTYNDFEIILNDDLKIDILNLEKIENLVKTFEEKKYFKNIVLTLVTPLRIKKDGVFVVDESITLESILNSIYSRSLSIQGKKIEKLPFIPKYEIISKDIYFNDLKRYSNLQKTSMNLGGIMGEIVISNIDEKSFNLLCLGELIAVGKQTVFGLGKINIGEYK